MNFTPKKIVTNSLILLVKFYQLFISPILPDSCKYYPSCSNYTIAAIQKYGPIYGSIRSIYRILRCNPWSKGGYDPV